ncbi:MAG: alpha/beta hydrolase, partial [Akkermansiaceae bacterium]|nr:alpha/beta hydrolase [Akkermansiaceae bacterium]
MSLFSRVPPIGQKRQQEMMKAAVPMAYGESSEGPLHAHVFLPEDFKESDSRPLVIFFHGGFWDASMPTQFVPHCLHFASRGAVAMVAETRLESLHRTGAVEALEDCQELLGWAAAQKDRLGIDPARVILGGSSGGAFLALNAALKKPSKQEPATHPAPAALVLFSSLLDPTKPQVLCRFPDLKTAKKLSPMKLVRRHAPPMILFHGRQDRITPFAD